jgi:hypothetical protein
VVTIYTLDKTKLCIPFLLEVRGGGGFKGWVRVAGKETYCQNYKHNFPVAVLYNLLSQVMILVVRGLVPTTVPPALTIRTSAFYPQIIFMGFD